MRSWIIYDTLVMCNEKKLYSLLLSLLLLSSCHPPMELKLADAINYIMDCDKEGNACPDSLFIHQAALPLELEQWNARNTCNSTLLAEELSSRAYRVNREGIQYIPYISSFNLSHDWIPPRHNIGNKMYISYSHIFEKKNEIQVILTLYLSGKNIQMYRCIYADYGNHLQFEKCDCRFNPY